MIGKDFYALILFLNPTKLQKSSSPKFYHSVQKFKKQVPRSTHSSAAATKTKKIFKQSALARNHSITS